MQYRYEIPPKVWECITKKASQLGTTAQAMIDERVAEFCNGVHIEIINERRNAIISRIVDLPEQRLPELEHFVDAMTKP